MGARGRKIDQARPTALYRLFNASDQLLYIGIAFEPEVRWRRHAKTGWGPLIARNEVKWFPDRPSARAVELDLIRTLQPPHNIAETPRKRWGVKHPSVVASARKPKSPGVLPADANDVLIRLAKQAKKEARSRARLELLIVLEYEAKMSLRDIARATKLSHEQVRRILTKNDVPIRGRGRAKAASTPANP